MTAASSASAATGHAAVLGAFRLSGSHGFRLMGLAYTGGEGKPGGLLLSVSKRGEGATYSIPARVTTSSVEADLGALGEIDLDIVPTGLEESARSRCGEKTYTYEGVRFEGTFDFRGEEGFTTFEASATPVLLDPVLDIVCATSGGSEVSGAGIPGARLLLRGRARLPRVSLQLNQNRPRRAVLYEAKINEERGAIKISRSVFGYLPGGSFSFEDDLHRAEFDGVGPFSGTGRYAGSSRVPSFSGNLSVDFPGRRGVALTGPGFDVSLVHARRTTETG